MKKLIALVLLTGFGGSLFAATIYRVCNLTDESINVKATYTLPTLGSPDTFPIAAGQSYDIKFPIGSIRDLDSLDVNDVAAYYDPNMLKRGDNTIGIYKTGDAWGVDVASGKDCSKVQPKRLELAKGVYRFRL